MIPKYLGIIRSTHRSKTVLKIDWQKWEDLGGGVEVREIERERGGRDIFEFKTHGKEEERELVKRKKKERERKRESRRKGRRDIFEPKNTCFLYPISL